MSIVDKAYEVLKIFLDHEHPELYEAKIELLRCSKDIREYLLPSKLNSPYLTPNLSSDIPSSVYFSVEELIRRSVLTPPALSVLESHNISYYDDCFFVSSVYNYSIRRLVTEMVIIINDNRYTDEQYGLGSLHVTFHGLMLNSIYIKLRSADDWWTVHMRGNATRMVLWPAHPVLKPLRREPVISEDSRVMKFIHSKCGLMSILRVYLPGIYDIVYRDSSEYVVFVMFQSYKDLLKVAGMWKNVDKFEKLIERCDKRLDGNFDDLGYVSVVESNWVTMNGTRAQVKVEFLHLGL